jgi:hypothetical protein
MQGTTGLDRAINHNRSNQPFYDFKDSLTLEQAAASLHCSLDYVRMLAVIYGLPIQAAKESEDSNEVV